MSKWAKGAKRIGRFYKGKDGLWRALHESHGDVGTIIYPIGFDPLDPEETSKKAKPRAGKK